MTGRAPLRMACKVSRSWYRARTTRKNDAHMWLFRNGVTDTTTVVLEDTDGRKMQIEMDPDTLRRLVELGSYFLEVQP